MMEVGLTTLPSSRVIKQVVIMSRGYSTDISEGSMPAQRGEFFPMTLCISSTNWKIELNQQNTADWLENRVIPTWQAYSGLSWRKGAGKFNISLKVDSMPKSTLLFLTSPDYQLITWYWDPRSYAFHKDITPNQPLSILKVLFNLNVP